VAAPAFLVQQFLLWGRAGVLGVDAHAYWLSGHSGSLYGSAPGLRDAFLYSPVFAQVAHPLTVLPFSFFYVVVVLADVACVAWLLAPLGWRLWVPLTLLCAHEYVVGNITGIMALSVVLALTGRPGWWSVGWFTKIVPGGLGLTWMVVRGEWRDALRAMAWTGGICGLSFAFWPSAWVGWIGFLQHFADSGQAHLRAVAALVFVAVGAYRRWWWTVPVALAIGAPVVADGAWLYALMYLTALPRLRKAQVEPAWNAPVPTLRAEPAIGDRSSA
jgi:hypothetical protein